MRRRTFLLLQWLVISILFGVYITDAQITSSAPLTQTAPPPLYVKANSTAAIATAWGIVGGLSVVVIFFFLLGLFLRNFLKVQKYYFMKQGKDGVTFSFQDIEFFLPPGCIAACKGKPRPRILKGISGIIKPGELVAIMFVFFTTSHSYFI